MNTIVDEAMSVTDEQIEALMREAGQAGDLVQVAICAVALGRTEEYETQIGDHRSALERLGIIPEHVDADVRARAECARVLSGLPTAFVLVASANGWRAS